MLRDSSIADIPLATLSPPLEIKTFFLKLFFSKQQAGLNSICFHTKPAWNIAPKYFLCIAQLNDKDIRLPSSRAFFENAHIHTKGLW